jgi:hypothetical protein
VIKVKLNLIVSIDTECDKGPAWKIKRPITFNNILEGIPNRLQPLFDTYEIKPTYLISPEVLLDEGCVGLFRSYGNRIELGTHLHPEFIEPCADWAVDIASSVQRDLAPEDEYNKLLNLTELFENKFGFFPKSFRAGRYGLSKHTLAFLERLAYEVDSSITPNKWWYYRKGHGNNFLGAPIQPYHPSVIDFRRPGNMNILEVPIALINPFWDKFPRPILRLINPFNRFQIVLLNLLFKDRIKPSWLRPTYSTVEEMHSITEYMKRKFRKSNIALCIMFHSNEATAGTSPYNATEDDVAYYISKLRRYFEILFSDSDAKSIGLSETKRIYA